MRNVQNTTRLPWLVVIVLFGTAGSGALAQEPPQQGSIGHENNTRPAGSLTMLSLWGLVAHHNNEGPVPVHPGRDALDEPAVTAELGAIGHGANERPLLGLLDEPFVTAAWGPIGHSTNEGPVPGLLAQLLAVPGARSAAPIAGDQVMPDARDLLHPQPVRAPLIGGPRAGAVPSPGAAALLALAALGAARRRRAG